jgi:predicted P-loop ATPase
VRDYLHGLVWDGSERMDHWLTTYLGAEDRPLYQAEGARWLISAVARILRPGAKADHALILIGIQGTLKSTALKALVPDETWFTDDTPVLDSKDSKQSTTGVWIIEFAELNSLLKSRHADVKAFLSRTTDRFRPPYGHHFGEFPRQCVFSGTVNHPEFNEDDTGGRRFWPVLCGKIQVKLLEQDRDQLWAEAVVRYHRKEPWWLDTDELNQLAAEEQDKCRQSDPWEPTVSSWLTGREEVTIEEILLGPLEMLKRDLKHTHAIRVGSILRLLGGQLSPGKRRPRRYQPPEGGW